MDHSPRIRIALLGAGGFATDAHLPAIAHNQDTLQLVALYSRSLKSATSLLDAARRLPSLASSADSISLYSDDHPDPQSHSLDALLDRTDIDAVALCLPIPAQPAIIRRCLSANKHVLSEKPLAPSLAEARALVQEYERDHAPRGVHWLVAEQFPYAPAWEKARDLVRQGKLGTLVGFDARVFIQPTLKAGATNWRRVPDYQGGFLLDGGVHFFAALRHVLSGSVSPSTSSPTELTALSAHVTQLDRALPPADTLRCLVSTSDPALSGTLTLSFGTPPPSSAKVYTFTGTDGVLSVDLGAGPRTVLLTLVSRAPEAEPNGAPLPPRRVEIELPAQTAVEREFAAFAGVILEGARDSEGAAGSAARVRSGPRAAMRDLAAVEGALKSGEREGDKVGLRELVGDEWWEVK